MSVYNRRASTVNLNQLVTNIPVRRKAADQVERDKFEWSQVIEIISEKIMHSFLLLLPTSGKVLRKQSIRLNHQQKKNMCEVRRCSFDELEMMD